MQVHDDLRCDFSKVLLYAFSGMYLVLLSARPIGLRPVHWGQWVAVLLWGAAVIPAWGQTVGAEVVAQVQSLDRFEAEQERLRQRMAEQAGYQDKFFDAQDIRLILVEEQVQQAEPDGVRTLLVEARLESNQQHTTGSPRLRDQGLGLRLEYRHETLNHGQWVVQADTRARTAADNTTPTFSPFALATDTRSGQKLTLRNQSFPVTPFVLADANLGDITSEVTDGLTRGQQFSLGSSNLRGASAHLFSRAFDLRMGLGARGQFIGGPYPGYERTQGQLAWIGYTHRIDPTRFAALQINQASQLPSLGGSSGSRPHQDTTSVAASLGSGHRLDQHGDTRLRLTAIHSRSETATASGAYLDAGLQHQRHRVEGGLYRTDPQLRFADQTVSNGNRGLYARYQHGGLRVNWGAGLSHDSQSPRATGGAKDWTQTSLNTHWTHRIDRHQRWGGNLQLTFQNRDTDDTSQRSHYGSLYHLDRWHRSLGSSRLQWTNRRNQALVSDGPAASGDELSWEQDWLPPQEPGAQSHTLRTQLGWAVDRSLGETLTYPTAGLTWQTWLPDDWSLGGSLRYTSRQGNLSTSRGLAGAIQTEKRLARDWTLGASLLMNQAVVDTQSPTGASAVNISRSDDKSLWVFLRFETQSGRPYSYGPRGSQGAGTGRITGQVFLDANRDGIQQADEPGIGGVEVFLNQRQRTTTDPQGRFEFGIVPTGPQSLSLRPESVPLPWGEGPRSRLTVDVPLRGTALAPLAVVKDTE